MALAPGSRLGTYEIVSLLDEGGMGEVYKALDFRLNRSVALKVLPAAAGTGAERRRRFEREAQVIAALNHPNIVTIYSVEQADGRLFLTMEVVEGRSLADVMPPRGLPPERLLNIAIPVVDAVAAAHQNGVTHRDLKPGNIMIGEGEQAGRIKVLDFGLAKLAEGPPADAGATTVTITAEGRILGTVAYMSPEQAEGKPIDTRSDLFSLGVILYEMATGQRPFTGETSISILSSILNDTPKSVTEIKPSLPRDLARIVRRALQKDPERRYQTAKDLRSDLEELKASLESDERVAQVRPWAFAVAALLTLLAGGVYLRMSRRAQQATPAPSQATSSLDDLEVTQLTTTGNAERPSISPDGKYVAYVQHDGNDYSLWIRQTATASNVRIVAAQHARLFDSTVTPDGNYVDFVKRRTGGLILELWRVPFLGGTPRRVLENSASAVGWSPDGRQMAFIRADIGPTSTSTALVSADADGGHQRALTTRRAPVYFMSLGNGVLPSIRPSWSLDGKAIALVGFDVSGAKNRFQIVLVDVVSGAERVLPVDGMILSLEWLSPSVLIMSRALEQTAPTQLWRLNLSDGKLSRLSNDLNVYSGIDLTTDRRNLVTSQSETRIGVWTGDGAAIEGAETVAPTQSSLNQRRVSWAGDRLLYTMTSNRGTSIFSVEPGKGMPEEVVNGGSPAASADGRTIVYVSTELPDRASSLWKANVDGTHAIRLVSDSLSSPMFADRDRHIVYVAQHEQQSLWIVPVDGGTPRQLSPMFAGRPDVASNGSSILFGSLDDQGKAVAMICELPACAPHTLARPANLGGQPRWLPGGRAIAYVDNTGFNLWTQPIDGGTPRQLTHFTDNRAITDFSWSRDGKHLAIARSTTTNDIVLFKGLKP